MRIGIGYSNLSSSKSCAFIIFNDTAIFYKEIIDALVYHCLPLIVLRLLLVRVAGGESSFDDLDTSFGPRDSLRRLDFRFDSAASLTEM